MPSVPGPDSAVEEFQPTRFAMIPRSFSEQVSVSPGGQQTTRSYTARCTYDTGRRFRTAAEFVPCLVPRHYISTITVDEDSITYFDGVNFAPSIRARRHEETVFSYPKRPVMTFTSTFCHDPSSRERYYVTGLDLVPAERLKVESVRSEPAADAPRRPSTCQEEMSTVRNGDVPQPLLEGAA